MSAVAHPDLILRGGLVTTLDPGNPAASAVAVADGVFTAVGSDREVMALAGPRTRVVDLKGRRVLPGLIDNHLHLIRGGLNFNMELRWDGVRSLADAMAMLKRQVAVTPPPQWVRVVGGFTEHQFAERRLPTLEELNAVAPDTPVFLLHLYDRALLNRGSARRRLHQGHARAPGRLDPARCRRQPDRAAARQTQRRDPLRHPRQGAEASVRVPGQLDPALHA
jgi:predicted amidohydrolase YtcJ